MNDIAPNWDADAKYQPGDYVSHKGQLLICRSSGQFNIDDTLHWASLGMINPDLEPKIVPLIFSTNCPNCGAPFHSIRCEYCGTYRRK